MPYLVPVSALRVGAGVVLKAPICSADGKKLIGRGFKITQPMINRLRERGVEQLSVHDVDLSTVGVDRSACISAEQSPEPASQESPQRETSSSRSTADAGVSPPLAEQLQRTTENSAQLRVNPAESPFADRLQQHGATPYDLRRLSRFNEENKRYLDQLDPLLNRLADGAAANLETVDDISQGTLRQVAEDMDLVLSQSAQYGDKDDPLRRSFDVARLATSIGVTIGFDEATLVELSIGCLLHDIGILKYQQNACQHTAEKSDLGDAVAHPEKTLQLLQRHGHQIPESSLLIAYQMHERCNGSGYPRGKSGDMIHDLAKIAAVADLFTALVMPGPGRDPMLPYHAMKTILLDVKSGLFDSDVVRAMLNTVSVCPIGSYVELSDQRAALVIRANREAYNRPVVEICDNQSADSEPTIIDLAQQSDLSIARAIEAPAVAHA